MHTFDLHVHTEYSKDSPCRIDDAIRSAKEKGLSGIAITDHDTVDGLDEALDLAEDEDFLIIPGIEVSSSDGHILGLGVEEKIPRNRPATEVVRDIRESGGIAVAAHPFSLCPKPFSPLRADFDAIEVLNSRRYVGNLLARKYASDRGIPFAAGSDSHFAEDVGIVGVELETELEVEKILEEIKNGGASVFGRTLPVSTYLRRALYKASGYM